MGGTTGEPFREKKKNLDSYFIPKQITQECENEAINVLETNMEGFLYDFQVRRLSDYNSKI